MEEQFEHEMIFSEPVSYDALLGKWLRFLLPVQVGAVALTVLSGLQILPAVVSFLSHAVSACVIVALFHMAPANTHYKTSAILRCVVLGGGLLSSALGTAFLSFAISICAIIGSYQEYKAHSEIISAKDAKLASQWSSLFVWQLAVGILTGILSVAGTVIGVILGISTEALGSVVLIGTALMSTCVQIFYLLYLKKMRDHFPL